MRDIAQKTIGKLEDAAGDMGYEQAKFGGFDIETNKIIKKMKAEGVTDIGGSLADHFYSDPNFIQDFLGDMLYDETHGDDQKRQELLNTISEITHNEAIKKACTQLRR